MIKYVTIWDTEDRNGGKGKGMDARHGTDARAQGNRPDRHWPYLKPLPCVRQQGQQRDAGRTSPGTARGVPAPPCSVNTMCRTCFNPADLGFQAVSSASSAREQVSLAGLRPWPAPLATRSERVGVSGLMCRRCRAMDRNVVGRHCDRVAHLQGAEPVALAGPGRQPALDPKPAEDDQATGTGQGELAFGMDGDRDAVHPEGAFGVD